MNPAEITETYEGMDEHDAFDAFNQHGADINDIERELGADVAYDYGCWLYWNIE